MRLVTWNLAGELRPSQGSSDQQADSQPHRYGRLGAHPLIANPCRRDPCFRQLLRFFTRFDGVWGKLSSSETESGPGKVNITKKRIEEACDSVTRFQQKLPDGSIARQRRTRTFATDFTSCSDQFHFSSHGDFFRPSLWISPANPEWRSEKVVISLISTRAESAFQRKTADPRFTTEIMPPQRLVRRKPLSQRLHALMNPMDFYLWLSEEIQTLDWDSQHFGTKFGLGANFVFLLARANIVSRRDDVDDVFGDAPAGGPLTWLASSPPAHREILVWLTSATRLRSILSRGRSFLYPV